MEFYAAERMKELIPFAMTWIELQSIVLREISQEMREKYHNLSFNWNIINKRKKQKNITRDIEVKKNLTIARGDRGRDSGKKGFQELL